MECLNNSPENLKAAVAVLKEGGVIAHAADTCYGLAGDLMNPDALRRLQQIKGRDADKPMSIMLPPHMKPDLARYATLDDFAETICEELLPGPVTIVLPKGPSIPAHFFPEIDTVGIRIPYDTHLNDLLIKFGHPIITTSANLSDQPVCCSCQDVIEVFEGQPHTPDLLLEGQVQGTCLPSTVIAVQNGRVRILRQGPMSPEELEGILGVSI